MTKKIILAIITIFILILIIPQINVCVTGMDFQPEKYKPQSTTKVEGADQLESIANNIIGPIRVVGSVISVIALIIIGIKYMMGSIEERAEYKKTMMPYLIGAIMVFAITNLLDILVNVIGGLL